MPSKSTRFAFQLAAYLVVGWFVGVLAQEAETTPPPPRHYETGKLTASDFAGKPDPARVQMGTSAFTVCELRWKYRTRYQEKEDGQVHMRVTRLDITCQVIPEKSWNLQPTNETLLEHEQGHFDIWYLNTLRARNAWKKKFAEGGITSVAATVEEADKLIRKKVDAFCKGFVDAGFDENRDYDQMTSKGANPTAQAEIRRVHQATIAQLTPKPPPEEIPPGKPKTKTKSEGKGETKTKTETAKTLEKETPAKAPAEKSSAKEAPAKKATDEKGPRS